jgi:SynChlorMet cassette radical SAM/SPASM protein ScmF
MSEFSAPRPLTQLTFYLGSRCGLTCRHCWVSSKHSSNGNGKKRYLPLETILQAVHEALPLGLQTVQINGSESFLYPEFEALIDQLEKCEVRVVIESSGAGLTGAQASRLARLPLCEVSIGLNGSQPAVGQAETDAYETAAQAIRQLARAGLAPGVFFLVTRRSIGQVKDVIRLAEELGAKSLLFTGSQLEIAGRKGAARQPSVLNTDILTVEELIALGRRIERELTNKTRMHLHFDQPPAFRGLHPLARIEGQGRCSILNNLAVLSGGEYALCGAGSDLPELVFGRVGADLLAQIWSTHPTLLTLRAGLPDRLEGVCERCVMKAACLGQCAVENYLVTGSFWGPNWFCQSADRVGLFPASRLIENQW